jgi:catechol 2,3-dioxygenase-like lactoylglutathione lyase family enzyme
MLRGFPNHLDLTVNDLERSKAFYDQVLTLLGYVRSNDYAGDVPCWAMPRAGLGFSIGLHQAKREQAHDRHCAGLHHLAFHADSRGDVDEFHRQLVQAGVTVLDAPAEYDYTPGYYALFFADPDGLKLELVFEPRFAAATTKA